MIDEIVAANKELVRRFYKEVYVDWNMALVDLMERWVVSDLQLQIAIGL